MTLPVSPASISISQINVELGFASNRNSNLNEAAFRTLAQVPSGAISMSNFYGKSNFTATAAPNAVGGSCTGATSCTATTNNCVATPSGNNGAVTYSWERVSGSTSLVALNPTAQTTAFRATASSAGSGTSLSAVFRCRLTDAASNVALTNDVSVSTTHTNNN